MRSEESADTPDGSKTSQIDESDPEAATSYPEEGAGGDARAIVNGAGELEASRDRYLRLAAEYDNFRKRTERERVEGRDRAQGQLVERLLEPLDDLQRVAQFTAEGTTVEALLEGVRMVERKLMRVLQASGLETLDAGGQKFDPAMHEALATAPTDVPAEDETVGEVFQPGYHFRGMLLRPARVQVRKHDG